MELAITLISLIGSVALGGFLVTYLEKSKNERIIKLMLAFSGGFLLSIGFIHFIPELYAHSKLNIGIFILMGFLIQLALEFFSGGIEHGHIHNHSKTFPYGLIIALCIHAFLEGVPLGAQHGGLEIATDHHHHDHGNNSLLLGILFHRLPVAVALMTLLKTSKVNTIKSWLVLAIFALMSPIGMLLGMYDFPLTSGMDFNAILAIVVGMLLHISTTIIFETSENHKFNFLKLLTIISGCALAFLIH